MAKTKAPPKQDNSLFRGFLNVDLQDEDKRIIKASEFDDTLFASWLAKKIDGGYKLTFSYDDYSRCFIVIGARSDKQHPDAGILLSGRGSTPQKAFKQWCYIVDRLIDGQSWSELLNHKQQVEIDD